MFLVHHHLDLPTCGQQMVAAKRPALANDFDVPITVDLDQLRFDTNLHSHRARSQMIHAYVGTDAFLMRFEKVDQHFSSADLEVVGNGPGGIDPVDHHAVERRAHIRRNGERQRSGDSWLESGLHDDPMPILSAEV